MVARHFTAVLVLAPVLAGFAAASATGVARRELSVGVTETIRPLPSEERSRRAEHDGVDLTRANCASTCEGVAGIGPNQGDCNLLIDALNAESTPTFTVGPYTAVSWVQASCTIEFIQSTADTITYTYTYLATVASYLSDTCNAANGYAKGSCIFNELEDAIWVGNTAVSDQHSCTAVSKG